MMLLDADRLVITSILTYLFLIGAFLLGVVLIAHILLQKRSPSGTLAWLLVILLMPYAGVPLYMMFGGRKQMRRAQKKERLGLDISAAIPEEDAGVTDRILRSYTIPGAQDGHRLTLCETGQQTFTELVRLIEGAQKSIHISTFIFRPDAVGRLILSKLAEKAAAGVSVRLLMDGVGSLHTRPRHLRKLTVAGGKVAWFMPVLHRPFRGRGNLRNHRKIVVVDYKTVLAGGANIGAEYIGPTPLSGRWRDLAFVLEGPTVRHWEEVFCRDWEFASGETPSLPPEETRRCEPVGQAVVQFVPSGPDMDGDALYGAILSMIFAAQRRLWVVTPYFVPDEPLCQALMLAARRGVDVRVMLPRRSNHLLADIVRGTWLRQIQQAGGLIMFYDKGMMHAKVLLMDDDTAVLGSANMDIRSLFLNYESAMFVYSPDQVENVGTWIEQQAAHCSCGIGDAGLVRTLAESVARLAAPLL
jgi:cardiolipin synthase